MSDAVIVEEEKKIVRIEDKKESKEKPVFDFKRVYWTHQQAYLAAFRRIQDKPTIENQEKWDEQRLLVVQRSVVSIPRNWLRDETPEKVDWSQEESTQWWLFGTLDYLHEAFVEAYKTLPK